MDWKSTEEYKTTFVVVWNGLVYHYHFFTKIYFTNDFGAQTSRDEW